MKKIKILLTMVLCTIFFASANAQSYCDAGFTTSSSPSGFTFVGNLSNSLIPNLLFDWDFGDGNTSTNSIGSNFYASNGTYTVCCIVQIPSSCIDTSCQVITVTTGSSYCNADFNYQDSLGYYTFNSTSNSSSAGSEMFNWTVDGVASGSMANFNTSINQPTSICLEYISVDSAGNTCSDLYCETIGSNYYPPDTNCTVDYTYGLTSIGSTIFTANSSAAPNTYGSIVYNWSLDGILIGSGSNTISQFLPPSLVPVNVCVEAVVTNFDGSICTSNYCDTISTNTSGYSNTCSSAFYYNQSDSVTFDFNVISNADSYLWDFGDGSTSTMMNPSHIYTVVPDSIDVCLTTVSTDVTGYTCTDITCLTITGATNVVINPSSIDSCSAVFVYGQGSNTFYDFSFQALQPNITGVANYDWDFGDGTTAYGESVTHDYASYGVYNVCLTVADTMLNCSETNCQLVDYNTTATGNASDIYGTVSLAGDDFAIVYLVDFNAVDSSLTVVDVAISSYLSYGAYEFYNVADGDYLVKAALIPGSEFYWDYLPTYYGDVELWNNASNLNISGNTVQGVDINLIAGVNAGGPGIITGLIADGAGKVSAIPIADAQVILYNNLNEPIAYTYADVNGNYTFENLPLGTYFVTVDAIGLDFVMLEVEITTNETTVNGVNLTAGDNGIVGINDRFNFIKTSVFPNPNNGVFSISLEDNLSNNAQLIIYNMIGAKVFESKIESQITNVNLSNQLSKGVYSANILDNEKVIGSTNFVVD